MTRPPIEIHRDEYDRITLIARFPPVDVPPPLDVPPPEDDREPPADPEP